MPADRARLRVRLLVVLGIALVARVLCLLPAARHPERFFTDDSAGYVALADDLRGGYLDPRAPTFVTGLLRTPVYPVFLSALRRVSGGHVIAVVAAQIGVSLVTVALAMALAMRTVGRRAALLGGLLLALDPASVLFTCLVQPETLFTVLLVAGVLAWATAVTSGSSPRAACAGALLGLAALTRPIGLFFALCLAPSAGLGPRTGRLALAGWLLLASSLPIGAWTAKNWLLTGQPVFSIAGDSSLLHYRAAGALAEDEQIPIDQARARVWQRLWAQTPPASGIAEISARQRALAFQILTEHPRGAVRMAWNGVVRTMAGTGVTALSNLVGDPDAEGVAAPWKRAVQALQLAGLALAYVAVGAGVTRLLRRRQWTALALLLGTVAYLVLGSAGPEANTRFRFPAAPFLAILAGYGLARPLPRVGAPAGAAAGRTTTVASR